MYESVATWELLHAQHLMCLTWDDTNLRWPLDKFMILWYPRYSIAEGKLDQPEYVDFSYCYYASKLGV